MNIRTLGRDLEVSAIGLGCMGMSHAYGPAADKKEMTKLLSQAVELGYTLFDTAEVYGTPENPHDNEELLGEALKPYRNKIVLASKCGIRFDETASSVNKPLIPDGRPETIKKSVDGSLKRLQTDHLDLYYIHRIDQNVPIEETAGAMKKLMEQGKITHWGISEADETTLRRAHAVCPVTAVQNRYSMMYRDYERYFLYWKNYRSVLLPFPHWQTVFYLPNMAKTQSLQKEPITEVSCHSFPQKELIKTRSLSNCFWIWQRRNIRHQHRFLWPGCLPRNLGLYQFLEPVSMTVWWKMRNRPM